MKHMQLHELLRYVKHGADRNQIVFDNESLDVNGLCVNGITRRLLILLRQCYRTLTQQTQTLTHLYIHEIHLKNFIDHLWIDLPLQHIPDQIKIYNMTISSISKYDNEQIHDYYEQHLGCTYHGEHNQLMIGVNIDSNDALLGCYYEDN